MLEPACTRFLCTPSLPCQNKKQRKRSSQEGCYLIGCLRFGSVSSSRFFGARIARRFAFGNLRSRYFHARIARRTNCPRCRDQLGKSSEAVCYRNSRVYTACDVESSHGRGAAKFLSSSREELNISSETWHRRKSFAQPDLLFSALLIVLEPL